MLWVPQSPLKLNPTRGLHVLVQPLVRRVGLVAPGPQVAAKTVVT